MAVNRHGYGGTGLSGRLWRAVRCSGACAGGDLLVPRVSGLGGLLVAPRQRACADLPTWVVTIEAHAVAARVLRPTLRQLAFVGSPRSVLTFAHFCFDDQPFLFWRSTVFDSTRDCFDAKPFLRESIFIFRFWRFRICPRREVPGWALARGRALSTSPPALPSDRLARRLQRADRLALNPAIPLNQIENRSGIV